MFERIVDRALDNQRVRNFVEDEGEEWVLGMLRQAARLPIVKINREAFLHKVLTSQVPNATIDEAIVSSPQQAGVSSKLIDRLADREIAKESRSVAGISFVTGLPGGAGLVAAVPADIVQYFAHMMRVEQKLAYLYGWPSLLASDGGVSEETVDQLIMLMGVMLGVEGAQTALRHATMEIAKQGMVKVARRRAVLQTLDQSFISRIVQYIAKKLGEEGAKKAIGKIVPLVGGMISGGMSYMSFKPAAKQLKMHLRSLPVAQSTVPEF